MRSVFLLLVIVLGVTGDVHCLTNPIHLARKPIKEVNAVIRLNVFTIKVQRQAQLGIFKSAGSEPVVLHFTNTEQSTLNPYQSWIDQVINTGRNMTKEQFALVKDFGYKEVFKNFRFMKDNYDSYRTLPLPAATISKRDVQAGSPVTPKITIQLVQDLVVVPLALADLGKTNLGDLCQALAKAWVSVGTHLCVYELEVADEQGILQSNPEVQKRLISGADSLARLPQFDPKVQGNFVAVQMPEGGMLGIHTERPEETPQAIFSSEPLQQYINSTHKGIVERVNQILSVYDNQITFAYGDVKEEIWLSDNQKIVEALNELNFWGSKLENDLALLDLQEIEAHTLPNLKKAFGKIHEQYTVNYVSHSKKIEAFEKKPFFLKWLLKYPLCTILMSLLGFSLAKFYINERKDIRKVFTKSYNI